MRDHCQLQRAESVTAIYGVILFTSRVFCLSPLYLLTSRLGESLYELSVDLDHAPVVLKEELKINSLSNIGSMRCEHFSFPLTNYSQFTS